MSITRSLPRPASLPAEPATTARTVRSRLAGGTFRALRHRNYQLYFFGQVVSLTGSWVQAAALTWLAYTLTSGSSLPAQVSAAQVVPTLLLGVWGGSLADRLPRRWLIFLTQSGLLVLAMLLAGMVACKAVSPQALLAVSVCIGVVNAVDTPSRLAFVVDMVGRSDLMNAVALNSLVFNVARAVGPAIGALSLPVVGLAGCFFLNGLTFVAVLVALTAMRLPGQANAVKKLPADTPQGGFAHLRKRPELVLLLVLAGSMAFFAWPVLALLPAHADQSLNAGYSGHAWMLSGIGMGALTGALLVATFGTPARRGLLIGLGLLVGVGALAGLSLTANLVLAVACCALAGCGLILFFATAQATMQLGADEHNRGRIMGIWLMVLSAAQPAGNLAAGQLADAVGVPLVLLLMAGGIALSACLIGAVALLTRRATLFSAGVCKPALPSQPGQGK